MGPISSTQLNPTHQTTDPTKPDPSQNKNFGPTNQRNPQPIAQSNSIQPTISLGHKEDNFNTSQSVIVYQVLPIYQYLSLSGYHVLLQQSQETYQVLELELWEIFLTHDPTQHTKKLKICTQPNPARGSTQPIDNSEPTAEYFSHKRSEYAKMSVGPLRLGTPVEDAPHQIM